MAYSLGLLHDGLQSVSDTLDAFPYHQLNPDIRNLVSSLKQHVLTNSCKLLSCLSTLGDSAQAAAGPALFELDKRLLASAVALSDLFEDDTCWRGSHLLRGPYVQQQLRCLDGSLICLFQILIITITTGIALNTPEFLLWLSDCFVAVERSPEQLPRDRYLQQFLRDHSFEWRCTQQQFQAALAALESTGIALDAFACTLLKTMYPGSPPAPPTLQIPTSSCLADAATSDMLQDSFEHASDSPALTSSNMTLDPITFEPMCDPVICSDDRTYDRFTILSRGTAVTSPFSLDRHELRITGIDHAVLALLTQEQKEQQAQLR
jgi:hypothetical protein